LTGFKGSFKHTIDQKGRVNIPAKFRRTYGASENYTIIKAPDQCLYIYPEDEWDKIDQRFRDLSQGNSKTLAFSRSTLVNATDVQADRQGRITIPASLLKLAGLGKEILINGMLNRMEVWDPDIFEKYLEANKEACEEVAQQTPI
jgi:MraZ protein